MSFLRFFGGGAGAQAAPGPGYVATVNNLLTVNEKVEEYDELLPSNPDSKQFGMENFGNTCYANSVLQALYFCKPFRDLVVETPDPFREEFPLPALPPTTPATVKLSGNASPLVANSEAPQQALAPPLPAPPTLFSALRSLYLHISTHQSNKGVVSPTSFITKLKKENELFRGPMHQDAHEFLNYLLNKIVEDLQAEQYAHPVDVPDKVSGGQDLDHLAHSVGSLTPSTSTAHARTERSGSTPAHSGHSTNSHSTLVQTLFEGTLTNETRCLTCETVSSRDESFLDLSIDIEENSSVTACLRQFSASEMLCQKNKFFCDSCCSLQEAEKRMKIKVLPNVLALHLKRFKLLPAEDKYVKLAYRVAFPLELRLFNTVDDAEDPDRLYRLFAIVVHIGGGPHHGHYITIVKSFGSIWRVFDDTNVSTIQESDIPRYFGDSSSGAGYVLFYQAADLAPEEVVLPPKRHATTERTDIPVPASPSKAAHYTNGVTTASTISPVPNHHQPSIAVADHTSPPNGYTPHRPPSAASLSHSQASPSGLAPPPLPIPVAPTYNDQPPPSPKLSKFLGVSTSARPHTPDANNRSGVSGAKTPQTPHTLAPTTPAASLGSPITPSTSIHRSLFTGRSKRPTSAVISPSAAPVAPSGREAMENSASGPTSLIPIGSPFDSQPHQKEKENHKEKSGTSWFRPKRKESLTSTAAAASAAAAAAASADSSPSPHFDASPMPDVKPRSNKRPLTGEKLVNLSLFASTGPSSSHAPIGASPATPTDSRRSAAIDEPNPLLRPRTAPGGGRVSPSSPSKRTSFDRSYHAGGAYDSSIPPVPPLPDLPPSATLAASTSSTLSPLPPPPSSFSNHNRRRSLSKQAGSLFSRPKSTSGDAAPLLNTSPIPSGPSHGQSLPASPVVQQSQQNAPLPPTRHPRRAASVLPLPSASSHSSAGAANGNSNGYGTPSEYVPGSGPIPRARPPPNTESDRPESMYVISSSAGPSHGSSSSSNRLAMSTSTPPSHAYSQQQQQYQQAPLLYQTPPSQSLQMPLVGTSSSTSSRDSGFGLFPPTPSPAPAPTASAKRASRKMSLSGTGSFFGGWGKDKDKDRERDRLHKENPSMNPPRPPSSNGSQPIPKSGANAFMGAF